MRTTSFAFHAEGNQLDGLFDSPTHVTPTATIIIVHGYGETHAVRNNWHYNLRSMFAEIGINTLMWDKPGCGQSEGDFDINQPVESSAQEVIEAVQELKKRKLPGTERIGLWGISRAGWIAPLAMQEEPGIDFWISVSGTDDKENARYLIETNLRAEGRTESEIKQLVSEWQTRFNLSWQGGTYQEYLDAGKNISKDPFMEFMGWGGNASEEEFLSYQKQFEAGELIVDKEDELLVYVPEFDKLLSSLNKPVLAIFGEKDSNVDWRKTAALYKRTIGTNPLASLTVKTFPDGDHVLKQTETGSIRELLEQDGDTPYVEGYYEAMRSWLVETGFGVE